jgi:adenosylcobinamide-GDP ribazoletransferase
LHVRADNEAPAPDAVKGRQTPPTHDTRRKPWSGVLGAAAFLTIAPIPACAGAEPAATAAWFPLVGAAVGAFAGGVRAGTQQFLGRSPATVLALIALVVVTGALHQDGLADTADGLGARGDRGRRLQVMRDSATGVFGALALIGWALLMLTTIASLDSSRAFTALVVACALARWAALAHARATPSARADGLGAAFGVGPIALGLASAVALALAVALCGPALGASAFAAALVVVALSATFVRRTLGGHTGDTLGATVAVTEVAVCATLLAAWHG